MGPINEKEKEEMKNIPYQMAVGSLLYAAQATRPDIAYAVGALSKFNTNPGKEHWSALKRVLRYLRGTTHYSIVYQKSTILNIHGYADADFADDMDDGRSVSGYIFKLADAAISWSSKKQQTVARSTTEAEYMALAHATQEALWLRTVKEELQLGSDPISIFCDNKSAIDLTKNSMYHARTKHIDIQHHFVREAVKNKQIVISKISTDEMVADSLTKAVCRQKHEFCTAEMGISS